MKSLALSLVNDLDLELGFFFVSDNYKVSKARNLGSRLI